MVGQYGIPSSSEGVRSCGICPMIGSVRRSVPVVRSPSSCHESPRSVVFHRMFVPAYRAEASCGEMMNGPSQLAGAIALPSRCSSKVPTSRHVSQLRRPPMWPIGSPGRMVVRSPVRMFTRDSPRYCDSVYTMKLLVVSTRFTKPSPPPSRVQSLLRMPACRYVSLGPIQDPLSCRPP